jgi:DNA-binding CsgD family transcriptional regulator
MLKSNDIHWIHEQLFAAAAGEIPFVTALETVIDAFDGAGGVVFEMNRKTGAISNWVGPGLEAGEADYINHLNSINPRMHFSLKHAPGHIIYEDKFIDKRSMDRHEFYDAIERSTGVQYFLGSRVFDEGNVSLFHSIEFTNQHGHPDKEKIDSFRHIAPAIGNAWRLARRSANSNGHNGLSPWTPDYLPWSIFALSLNGTIVEMNTSAGDMLARADVLSLHDGVLKAVDPTTSTSLEAAMQRGMAGETSELLLSTDKGYAPLIAQIVPVNPAMVSTPQPISVLVYVWNPIQRNRKFGSTLARLYGFTLAETRLAEVLANGTSMHSAADQLGISRNTAGNQLQKMFAKTGTHRQSEFLVKIMGILEN